MKRAYLGAILCLVWAALIAWDHLRQRPAPEDEVQPPDPRTVALRDSITTFDGWSFGTFRPALPEHDPAIPHVDGCWMRGCRRCEEIVASWRVRN
jgi:hypothetical protein